MAPALWWVIAADSVHLRPPRTSRNGDPAWDGRSLWSASFSQAPFTFNSAAPPLISTPALIPMPTARNFKSLLTSCAMAACRMAASTEMRQTVDIDRRDPNSHRRNVTRPFRNSPEHLQPSLETRQTLTNSHAQIHTAMRTFHYGDRIRFSAKLKLPRNFRNPGAFDYQGYLADRGIVALGSAKIENVEVLPGFSGNRLASLRNRLHRGVIAKVHQLWPPREAALLDAMVIGEEAFIDRDTRVDFQRSGTYHVLVVSGMNVGILAFVVFWSLRKLRIPEIPATLLTVAFCAGYAFITEVGAPVWRATLMCAVYLGTRLLYRDRAMVNALGAAALGLLVIDPRQLFTASFQMTFVCVLIVAAIGIPILQRTSQL